MKFNIEPGYRGREAAAVRMTEAKALALDGLIVHVGSVAWVESFIGPQAPDYYPAWTRGAWHRQISSVPVGAVNFVKPTDRYKRFDGHVIGPTDPIPDGPLVYSEPVKFVVEWRHYCADGVSLCSWWYSGPDETCDTEPNGPPLPFELPAGYCGAVDIGRLDTGEIALVEVQHPYAIGWYGEMCDAPNYARFLEAGWASLSAIRRDPQHVEDRRRGSA